jgi:hypothetical protein
MLLNQSRNSPGFIPSIILNSEIWGAANEAVSNKEHKKKKTIPFHVSNTNFTSICEKCSHIFYH